MTTFRPVPDADRRRYRAILQYAFSPQEGPLTDDPEESLVGPFDSYGVYADDELVSTCKLYELDAWIRDGYGPIGGLGAVATPPEHRRNGYIRELCRGVLAEFESRGAGLVTLWPFETSFYANLGWATANHVTRYECPPEVLPAHDAEGRMCQLSSGEWERLGPTERAHGEGLALSLRRSERWWRERTLTNWTGGAEPYVYAYERDGEVAGYLTYSVADDENETLTVDVLAYADEEAYRAVLSFLGTHGAQIERVAFTRPEGAGLFDRVDEPERVDCEVHPGPMVRLTSVRAMEFYTIPGNLACTLVVTDPLAEEEGVYDLTVEDGDVSVTSGSNPASADATVDVGTLTQLLVGTHGV
ncbi:MAG: GNAT family N-acetyltransferase, partial [Natrialbaceae archaeon]